MRNRRVCRCSRRTGAYALAREAQEREALVATIEAADKPWQPHSRAGVGRGGHSGTEARAPAGRPARPKPSITRRTRAMWAALRSLADDRVFRHVSAHDAPLPRQETEPPAAARGARLRQRPPFSPGRRCGSICPARRSSATRATIGRPEGRRRDERRRARPPCRGTANGGNGAGRQARSPPGSRRNPAGPGAGRILRRVSLRRER